jgi:4-carboxymuconolactone decarboxylase
MSDEKRAKGAAKFEEVIGFAPPEKGPEFLRITVENLFGDVWSREGLGVRDRRLITLTVLALLGKESSMELHLRQALVKNEMTKKELEEVMIHLAHYAGWPVAQVGFDALMKVVAELRKAKDAAAT